MKLWLPSTLAAVMLGCALPALAAGFTIPPTPDHYVTDGAAALSQDAHTAIETELRAYEKATGHQVVVWIGQTTGGVPLETWTGETADRWKIGRRGHEDGAVLFLFMRDHKVRIEVGYGLEASLTDADAHRIIADDIVPKMKSGDADGAVSAGVSAMLATVTPSYKTSSIPQAYGASRGTSSGHVSIVVMLLFLFFGLFVVVAIIMQILGSIRYGYLVTREGSKAAKKDMKGWWFWGSGAAIGGGGWSSGGGGGGFSAGGGGFGGGGASGGW